MIYLCLSDLEDLVQCQNDSDCPEDSTCPTKGDIKMKNICMCVRELRPLKKDGSCNSGKYSCLVFWLLRLVSSFFIHHGGYHDYLFVLDDSLTS